MIDGVCVSGVPVNIQVFCVYICERMHFECLCVCVCGERVRDYISSFPVKRLVGLLFPGSGWVGGRGGVVMVVCPLCPDGGLYI